MLSCHALMSLWSTPYIKSHHPQHDSKNLISGPQNIAIHTPDRSLSIISLATPWFAGVQREAWLDKEGVEEEEPVPR